MLQFKCSEDDKNDRLFKYELIWISFMFSDNDLTRIDVESEGTINHEEICSKVWGSKNSRILSRMTSSFEISVWDLRSLCEWAYECDDKFEGTSVNHWDTMWVERWMIKLLECSSFC